MGQILTGANAPSLAMFNFSLSHLVELGWEISYPLSSGGMVTGLLCAIPSYFITKRMILLYQAETPQAADKVVTLRRQLKELKIRPGKELGQHFVVNSKILQRIIESASLEAEDIVVEIGAGLGSLTAPFGPTSEKSLCHRGGSPIGR